MPCRQFTCASPSPHMSYHMLTLQPTLQVYASAGADAFVTARCARPDAAGAVARIRPSQHAIQETCIPAAVVFTGHLHTPAGYGAMSILGIDPVPRGDRDRGWCCICEAGAARVGEEKDCWL
jgi:hypothetical protein